MKKNYIYISIFTFIGFISLSSYSKDVVTPPREVDTYKCKRIDPQTSSSAKYQSINSGINSLDGSMVTLEPLFDKLLRIKQGSDEVVSILHIGDSHIQGGYSTNPTRDLLAAEFGFAGTGLVMPYKIIKTNGGLDYTINSVNNWSKYDITRTAQQPKAGFTGYAIESKNRAVEFVINADSSYNSIRVLHGKKAPLLMVSPSLSDLTLPNTATEESTDIILTRSVKRAVLRGREWNEYNNHSYYGFILENGRPGVLYHTLGVNGACFKHYADAGKISSLSVFKPDLVIISLGTNDSFYTPIKEQDLKQTISKVVRNLKEAAPNAPIVLTTPIENYRNYTASGRPKREPNANISSVSNIIKSVVADEGLLVWDIYSILGGKGSSLWLTKSGVMRQDGIHFSAKGYEMQGELIYDAIASAYNDYISKLD